MVACIVGNYLIEKNLLTEEQFLDLLAEQQRVRVKLGLIAVAEGLMTEEETEKINKLQAIKDMRFGDIAVEKGYLMPDQVDSLLKKQGNAYLTFAQSLENNELMTIAQLEQYMLDYAQEYGLTISDIEDLKSDDVERILPYFLPVGADNRYMDIAGIAVRMLMRCVDNHVYPKKAVLVSEWQADNGALQHVTGDKLFTTAFAGKGMELIHTASIFGEEDFDVVDEDTLDAVGELINCINGVYATALSQDGVILELMPPEYSASIQELKADEMLVLPLVIKGETIHLILSVDRHIEMK